MRKAWIIGMIVGGSVFGVGALTQAKDSNPLQEIFRQFSEPGHKGRGLNACDQSQVRMLDEILSHLNNLEKSVQKTRHDVRRVQEDILRGRR